MAADRPVVWKGISCSASRMTTDREQLQLVGDGDAGDASPDDDDVRCDGHNVTSAATHGLVITWGHKPPRPRRRRGPLLAHGVVACLRQFGRRHEGAVPACSSATTRRRAIRGNDDPMTDLQTLFEEAGVTAAFHALDLGSGREVTHCSDDLVIMASVFKLPVLLEAVPTARRRGARRERPGGGANAGRAPARSGFRSCRTP